LPFLLPNLDLALQIISLASSVLWKTFLSALCQVFFEFFNCLPFLLPAQTSRKRCSLSRPYPPSVPFFLVLGKRHCDSTNPLLFSPGSNFSSLFPGHSLVSPWLGLKEAYSMTIFPATPFAASCAMSLSRSKFVGSPFLLCLHFAVFPSLIFFFFVWLISLVVSLS